jgi:DNA-binding MarR family transcriptional regulator
MPMRRMSPVVRRDAAGECRRMVGTMSERPPVPRYADQLRRISALGQRFHGKLAAALRLNATSLDAMEWLEREGPLTPTELAARLGVTPAAVTGVIDRLEATGHARRERRGVDRRSVHIVPNPASLADAARELGPLIGELRARLGDYTPEEMAVIERFLDDVAASYQAGIDAVATPVPNGGAPQ